MDIQMPYLDGTEATKEILEYENEYIIALTANALKGDRERFLADGLDEYTTKPIVRSEIISLLNQFLSESIVTLEEPQEDLKPVNYAADILLAKKTGFEAKIYKQILQSLGYSFEIANSTNELNQLASQNIYKLVLFDKECEDLDLQEFSKKVKQTSQKYKADSYMILTPEKDNDDELYVHEVIDNIANKETLKLIIEKFIKGNAS
jgi:CheY-like chemotaxis protein